MELTRRVDALRWSLSQCNKELQRNAVLITFDIRIIRKYKANKHIDYDAKANMLYHYRLDLKELGRKQSFLKAQRWELDRALSRWERSLRYLKEYAKK